MTTIKEALRADLDSILANAEGKTISTQVGEFVDAQQQGIATALSAVFDVLETDGSEQAFRAAMALAQVAELASNLGLSSAQLAGDLEGVYAELGIEPLVTNTPSFKKFLADAEAQIETAPDAEVPVPANVPTAIFFDGDEGAPEALEVISRFVDDDELDKDAGPYDGGTAEESGTDAFDSEGDEPDFGHPEEHGGEAG